MLLRAPRWLGWTAAATVAYAAVSLVPSSAQEAARVDADVYSQLCWRHIGPAGNRVSAVAGVPGDPLVYYAGAASGGIFKTTDAGIHWQPVFDDQPVASIGSLAVAPSDPSIVWAGTGESCIRSHISVGEGIFKSVDAGKSWTRMGLEQTGRIGRVVVHPTNPEVVLACALGHAYGPQPERGVFRTTDGGASWEHVLFVDEDTVAITRSNPNRVYALIETGDGVPWKGEETESGQVWRSEDGGESWRVVSYDRHAMGRAHYYSHLFAAPDNEHEVYFLTSAFSVSLDGGRTLEPRTGQSLPGWDHHDMWIDPTNANRMIVGHDQGVSVSQTRGRTWRRQRLANAQMYHVTVDNQIPYYVYGNQQDGPGFRGPSNSRSQPPDFLFWEGGIPRGMWHVVGGHEYGWATPDPVDPNIIWSTGCGDDRLDRYEENRRQFRNVEVWPGRDSGAAADLKYRFVCDAPLHISPHDHNTVYFGSQHVHRTTDGGQSWQVISPDLTLNDKSRQQLSGGLTPDNMGVEQAGVVYAIAESPRETGLIWVGTNDGLVQLTRDGGESWTNVTGNLPNLPEWGTVSSIEPSRYDAGTAYATVDFHQVNNRDPFVYKTADYGATWRAITTGIPKSMLSYVHWLEEDPVRRGLLYLGTENAIYVSFDDGDHWQPLQTNLPHAPVYGIVVQEHFNDLVIGTYGRGFWILDDITPLQQLTPQVLASEAHLFPPRAAYRFRDVTPMSAQADEPSAGENPPYGASINYYLQAASADAVTITILDEQGQVVRTLTGPQAPGLNRLHWDLRYELTKEVQLRTSPLYAPHVTVGPEGWRPMPGEGAERLSILAPPGTYTVQLSVGGRQLRQTLEVRKDPHSAGTEADIQAQTAMLFELRRDLESAVDVVNQIELVRSQIANLIQVVEDEAITEAGDELDQKLIALEGNLVELRETGRGQDARWGRRQLIRHIRNVAKGLASADFRPTDQQVEVQQLLQERLRTYLTQLDGLLSNDLSAFNELLRTRNVSNIIARMP